MAPPPPRRPVVQRSLISLLLLPVVLLALPTAAAAGAGWAPFRARDLLPLLPRGLTWPAVGSVHSAVDLLPRFVAHVAPEASSAVAWRATCFADNEAVLTLTHSSSAAAAGRNATTAGAAALGGALLRLKVPPALPLAIAVFI